MKTLPPTNADLRARFRQSVSSGRALDRYNTFKQFARTRIKEALPKHQIFDDRLDYFIDQLAFRLSHVCEAFEAKSEEELYVALTKVMDVPGDVLTYAATRDVTSKGPVGMEYSLSRDNST